jgi:hypothetical protein
LVHALEITTYFAVMSDKLKNCFECLKVIVDTREIDGHPLSTDLIHSMQQAP